jgi:hypothetical protein
MNQTEAGREIETQILMKNFHLNHKNQSIVHKVYLINSQKGLS